MIRDKASLLILAYSTALQVLIESPLLFRLDFPPRPSCSPGSQNKPSSSSLLYHASETTMTAKLAGLLQVQNHMTRHAVLRVHIDEDASTGAEDAGDPRIFLGRHRLFALPFAANEREVKGGAIHFESLGAGSQFLELLGDDQWS